MQQFESNERKKKKKKKKHKILHFLFMLGDVLNPLSNFLKRGKSFEFWFLDDNLIEKLNVRKKKKEEKRKKKKKKKV